MNTCEINSKTVLDNSPRMRLRSRVPKTEKPMGFFEKRKLEKNDILERPYMKYNGKLNYCTNFFDCALLCDALLKRANAVEDVLILGFDLEWPWNPKTGSKKTAVMQISEDTESCHVIHMTALDKIPKNLSEVLTHPKVCLTGVNIKNDVRKLSRDYSRFDGETIIKNCVDLSTFANTVLPFQQRWSLEKLVGYCFNKNIIKDKNVRMSKWNIIPLSKNQLNYAALDSYASLKLYYHLKELHMAQQNEPTKKLIFDGVHREANTLTLV